MITYVESIGLSAGVSTVAFLDLIYPRKDILHQNDIIAAKQIWIWGLCILIQNFQITKR